MTTPRSHPETLDPSAGAPLPVEPVDVLAHTQRVLHLDLRGGRGSAAGARALRGRRRAGSNAWAIAPARSASGKALLVANPHLPWGDLFTWFEAHLSAPGVNATGATLVGQNLLGIGFNEHLGWTHTVNTIDAADIYELTLAEGGYRFDGAGFAPSRPRPARSRCRQDDGSLTEESLVLKRSVHGAVIEEKPGRALALRVAGLDQPAPRRPVLAHDPGHEPGGLRSRRCACCRCPCSRSCTPTATATSFISSADAPRCGPPETTTGLEPSPATPRRRCGPRPTPTRSCRASSTPRRAGCRTRTTRRGPRLSLRSSIPIASPATWPRAEMGFRPQRSARMLAEDDQVTWDELLADKHSTRMELADRILDDLAAAVANHGTTRPRSGPGQSSTSGTARRTTRAGGACSSRSGRAPCASSDPSPSR